MHIFQNFLKILVLDTSEVDCSIVELMLIRTDTLLSYGKWLHVCWMKLSEKCRQVKFSRVCTGVSSLSEFSYVCSIFISVILA
jgi:hypothetical protein